MCCESCFQMKQYVHEDKTDILSQCNCQWSNQRSACCSKMKQDKQVQVEARQASWRLSREVEILRRSHHEPWEKANKHVGIQYVHACLGFFLIQCSPSSQNTSLHFSFQSTVSVSSPCRQWWNPTQWTIISFSQRHLWLMVVVIISLSHSQNHIRRRWRTT